MTVIRRVDDNWAEGMLGDKIGIFPILYVEVSLEHMVVDAGLDILWGFCASEGRLTSSILI